MYIHIHVFVFQIFLTVVSPHYYHYYYFNIMTAKTIYEIWTCVFCKQKAKDALNLEVHFLDGDDVPFFDDPLAPLAWYTCDNCTTEAHFSCLLAKLKIYISYSDFRSDRRFYWC